MKIAICDDDKNELFRILSVLADYQTQRNIEFSYKPFRQQYGAGVESFTGAL